MDIVGLESSDSHLINFMYGFDPKKIIGVKKFIEIIAMAFITIVGLFLLLLFLYLHYSQEVAEYINKVNTSNTTAGFRLVVFVGITKLILIILGLIIPSVMIYKFILKTKDHKNAL